MFFINIFCTIGYPSEMVFSLKNLHRDYHFICPGLDFLFYLFYRCGAKFFRGERRGIESNPGYCGNSLKPSRYGYNVTVFSGITLLVAIGYFHHKKSSGEEVTLFCCMFYLF